MPQIFFATSNPAKLEEARKIATTYNVDVISPIDILDEPVDVIEDGQTFHDNAHKKFSAYAKVLAENHPDLPLMADDGGITIDALGGAPGVKSRRWKDGSQEMSDQELIDYCLEQLEGIPPKNRGAQFVSVIAYGLPSQEPRFAEGKTTGTILEAADMSGYVEGYPFRALFYMPEYHMLLHDLTLLPPPKRPGYVSHREKSIKIVLSKLFGSEKN